MHRPLPTRSPAVVALLVVLLVLGPVAAVLAANANDGAASPADAARAMLDRVAAADLGGAVAELPPGERQAILAELGPIGAELQRLGLLRSFQISDLFGGASGSLHVEGLELWSEVVGWDVARVRVIAGRLVGTMGDLGLRDDARALLRDATGIDLPAPGSSVDVDLAEHRVRFITMKEGGGWHVSLWETLAEAIRNPDDPPPAWRDTPPAAGATAPDLVVNDLADAASNLDGGRAFSLALPDEAHALHTAAPLLLPAMRRDASRWIEEEGFGFPPPRLVLATEGSGTVREVRVTEMGARVRDRDGTIGIRYDGECLTFDHWEPDADLLVDVPRSELRCDGDLDRPFDPATTGDRLRQVTVWAALGKAFPTFVVEERNGRWFLSPTRTILTSLRERLAALAPDDVPAFVARAGTVAEAYRPRTRAG